LNSYYTLFKRRNQDGVPSKIQTTNFCSQSCAAKFNNKLRRKHPIKPKQFTPASGPYTSIKYKQCNICNKWFWSVKKNTYYNRLCSDNCFYVQKKRNCTGRKFHIYKDCLFESNWEVIIATFFDDHNIAWTQPDHSIKWIDSRGKSHKYYPDFYLPTLNIYVDPKNPYVIRKQQEKLAAIEKLSYIHLIYGDITKIKYEILNLAKK